MYRLPPGSRVADAIAAAGGFGPRVDAGAASRAINLATPVHDGDQIHVPSRDEPTTGGPVASGASGGTSASGANGSDAGEQVDLNTATEQQLDALPGVGPATVAKIVAARAERPFASIEELRDRKIVGSATFDKLRDLIVVH